MHHVPRTTKIIGWHQIARKSNLDRYAHSQRNDCSTIDQHTNALAGSRAPDHATREHVDTVSRGMPTPSACYPPSNNTNFIVGATVEYTITNSHVHHGDYSQHTSNGRDSRYGHMTQQNARSHTVSARRKSRYGVSLQGTERNCVTTV
jgi:hypothetical protein